MAGQLQRGDWESGAKIVTIAVLSLLGLLLVGCTVASNQAATNPAATNPAVQHTVTLSWNENSSNISGYNVYRSTVSGGPYTRINTALEAATNYVDNTVASGTTYYYVVTSVNLSGVESANSNQVTAIVP